MVGRNYEYNYARLIQLLVLVDACRTDYEISVRYGIAGTDVDRGIRLPKQIQPTYNLPPEYDHDHLNIRNEILQLI